jgi:hypothetical protein
MNKINAIYTTVSYGRTHIAADNKYIGSVDSYNNCFTQLFAWIFRQSMTVNFDGKVRSVNKESYRNLLLSLKKENEVVRAVSNCHFFRKVAENAKLPQGNMKMRNMISASDRYSLFRKLANAISRGDTDKALLMIGKGAALDIPYYERTGLPPSFKTDTADLSGERRYKFNVFKATPILQASVKANEVVVHHLKEAGANLSVTGQQYTFERAITNVERNLDLSYEPTFQVHRYGCRRQTYVGYRPIIREQTTIRTEDTRTRPVDYKLN